MLRAEPEGGFTAIVPTLPGCVTFGRTLAEARTMAKDAISGYIERLKKHKEPVHRRRNPCGLFGSGVLPLRISLRSLIELNERGYPVWRGYLPFGRAMSSDSWNRMVSF
jgi:predicted RNase H-like HicB family nuclease